MDDDNDENAPDDEGETFEMFYRSQQAAASHAQPDHLLSMWVSVINTLNGDFGFDVTLFVDGLIVTGTLTSGAEWMGVVAQRIDDEVGPERGKVITDVLREFSIVYQIGSVRDDSDTTSAPLTTYVHLKDATILQGGHCVASEAQWRGRLVTVSGWLFGRLSTPAD